MLIQSGPQAFDKHQLQNETIKCMVLSKMRISHSKDFCNRFIEMFAESQSFVFGEDVGPPPNHHQRDRIRYIKGALLIYKKPLNFLQRLDTLLHFFFIHK